jgi:hypothetical protein
VQHVHIRNNIFETEGTTQLVQVTATQLDGAVDLLFQGNTYFAHSGGFKIVWGASTLTTITSFRSKGQEVLSGKNVGFSGDPLLVAPGTAGTIGSGSLTSITAYKLQNTSACINTGLNLLSAFGVSVGTHDFWGRAIPQGAGYEVGAYEADASAPGGPPPPPPPPPPPTGGSIAGKVWNDADGDGVLDTGEAGVAGITVYNDANNNSAKDTGELTATTDSSGNYIFNNLAGGSYKIRQILQSGWSQTSPANGFGWTITLSTNQVLTGKNFGTKGGGSPPPTGGSISGKVFNDANGNGTIDTGELGIANITVYNDANNNNMWDTGELKTLTDSSGNYILSNLAAGSYKIRQILQTGWSQTTPANGFGWTITLATNQVLTGKNFGTKKTA